MKYHVSYCETVVVLYEEAARSLDGEVRLKDFLSLLDERTKTPVN